MPELPRDQTLHLTAVDDGKTLGEVVRKRIGVSWGQAEQMMLSRQVTVHGNLCLDAARRMKRGDVVKVLAQPMPRPATADDLVLPHIDRHLVVVEKPPGITSVRHVADRKTSKKRRQLQPTLDELLAVRLGRKGQRKGKPVPSKGPRHNRFAKRRERSTPDTLADIFPVHRLDRDTSGLMLFAKTREAERALVAAFKRHDIERAYRAVVWGHPKPQTIESHLARDRGDGRRGSVLPGHTAGDAQHAVTHVRPIKALGDYHL
ncbi:MAG: pseudouridine synthase, partial [Planctomycetota bacterium]